MKLKRKPYTPPVRYWRWLWLAHAARVLAWPLLIVVLIPYLVSKGIVAACDWMGGQVNRLYVHCLNRDRQRAINDGYDFNPRLPAPQLSPEWARIRDRER